MISRRTGSVRRSLRSASLRGRMLRAFVAVVVLAVVLGVASGYYITERQLDAFVAQLADVEADNVARHLSREYAAAGGWATVDRALADAGYLYAAGGEHAEGRGERAERPERERERGRGRGAEASFHIDRIRIVVVDSGGAVVRDNLSRLRPGAAAPELGGARAMVVDRRNGLTVGYAYVDVEREFLSAESHGFLRATLVTTASGGVLIAIVAVALSAWIARRIAAPVSLLTRASQKIAQGEEAALLPVTSTDELGQMSDAFNRMTTALDTQRALRRRLINDLSHELNTPLSVIQLEAKGLLDGLQKPDEAADRIIAEVTLLANLVRDLSWLAETDSGELRLHRERCRVDDLLDDELHRWQPQARLGGISLEYRPHAGLPALDLDRMRLSQALGNVVQNALQHTAAGGRITLAAAPAPAGGVAITVADDGVGIAAADLPHLFERLYRGDASRTRGVAGSGLGLAIARAIVTAHAGDITIGSDGPGRGTTVRISLPG